MGVGEIQNIPAETAKDQEHKVLSHIFTDF